MITDAEFRERFFRQPDANREYRDELTAIELTALMRLDVHQLGSLAAGLDARIVRAATPGSQWSGRRYSASVSGPQRARVDSGRVR